MVMILSFLWLGRRYNFYQVFAVLIILLGLGIAIYPSIRGSEGANQIGRIFWNVIFVLGSVPAAVYTVYEEKAFEEQVCISNFYSGTVLIDLSQFTLDICWHGQPYGKLFPSWLPFHWMLFLILAQLTVYLTYSIIN
jgi:drug/metabolite transporter (DMT)-like permease